MADEVISRADARARGLKRYFTGKLCLEGHLGYRLVSNCGCIPCAYLKAKKWNAIDRAKNPEKNKNKCKKRYHENLVGSRTRAKIWRDKNPEKVREQKRKEKQKDPDKYLAAQRERDRKWRLKNQDRVLEIARKATKKWREQNPAKAKAAEKAWRRLNPDKVRESSRLFRKIYPEKAAASVKRWMAEHPERHRLHSRRRRARKRNAAGSHTETDILEILKLQKGKCAYCSTKFCKTAKYAVDHITALSRGGSDDRRNLQLLCNPCNSSKWANDAIDFARSLGKLI